MAGRHEDVADALFATVTACRRAFDALGLEYSAAGRADLRRVAHALDVLEQVAVEVAHGRVGRLVESNEAPR